MKIKFIYILLTLFILTLSSCKKALDLAPEGKLSMTDIFTDNNKVGAFLNSLYTNMPMKGVQYESWERAPVEVSDEAWGTMDQGYGMSTLMYNGSASASWHPFLNFGNATDKDYWSRYWTSIRNCNLFISNVNKATITNETDRKRWNAEAHLLRAYYYSELLKWFGASIPIDSVSYNFTDDFSKIKKANSYYDVVKFIMSDCNFALATAELPWRITSDGEEGRVNKAMAEAIKSKMILFAASPLNNAGKDYWQEAYTVNKASLANLKANGYALYNKVNFPQTYLSDIAFLGPNKDIHTALYNEYFNVSMSYSSNPVDMETIFQGRNNQNQSMIFFIDGIGIGGDRTGTCPSQELVDAYETIDGQPILDLKKPYLDDKHTQPNYNKANTLYDPNDPYKNRDPRFYATIYYNGSKRNCMWGFAETPACYENYPAPAGVRTRVISTYVNEPMTGISNTNSRLTRTGYFERKFLHPNSSTLMWLDGARWKFFRLGEVILDFAEAAAEANKLAEATEAVNEIRSRAGMPDIPASLPKAELILRIHNERRVELALEENRYFDIRRWSLPTDDLSKTDRWVTAMSITRNSDGTFTYTRIPVRPNERLCYANKFLWLPIPLDEANRLKAITGVNWQNPGW